MDGIRIKKTGNGYTVCVRDPEIVKKNHKSDGAWRDPEVEFVFTDKAKLVTFVTKALETLAEGDEYETAFAAALAEDAE